MANITDLKIASSVVENNAVASMPDNPSETGMSAQELKEAFDALPKTAINALNALIDFLAPKVAKSISIDEKTYVVTVTMYDNTEIKFDLSAPTDEHNVAPDSHADIRKLIQTNAENIQSLDKNKAPAYTYGTTDLIEGVSPLPTGTLYFVYE